MNAPAHQCPRPVIPPGPTPGLPADRELQAASSVAKRATRSGATSLTAAVPLSQACVSLRKPRRASTRPGPASPQTLSPGGRDGRGNELFT
jgi:hypothetical protein